MIYVTFHLSERLHSCAIICLSCNVLESQMNFDDQFQSFRNILRDLDNYHLVLATINRLHEIQGLSPTKMKGAYPWYLLLLLRWVFEYETLYPYKPRAFTESTFVRLVNAIHEME